MLAGHLDWRAYAWRRCCLGQEACAATAASDDPLRFFAAARRAIGLATIG
jgi:hypothetical protein